jgi:hypothetical protein
MCNCLKKKLNTTNIGKCGCQKTTNTYFTQNNNNNISEPKKEYNKNVKSLEHLEYTNNSINNKSNNDHDNDTSDSDNDDPYVICNNNLMCYGGKSNCSCGKPSCKETHPSTIAKRHGYNQLIFVFNPNYDAEGTSVINQGSKLMGISYNIYDCTGQYIIGMGETEVNVGKYLDNANTFKIGTEYTFISRNEIVGTISWLAGYKTCDNTFDFNSIAECIYSDISGTGIYRNSTGKIRLVSQSNGSIKAYVQFH